MISTWLSTLMTAEDLSDAEHLQAYQTRIKQLFHMEKFAFVKADGWLYTSSGPLRDENSTRFDYVSLTEPQIGISNPDSTDKKVCFAVPLKGIDYHGIGLSPALPKSTWIKCWKAFPCT